jgi:hypothetical protein
MEKVGKITKESCFLFKREYAAGDEHPGGREKTHC